jgi:hypothetical protein
VPLDPPEEGVVGRQPGQELTGVADHDLLLLFDAEEFIKRRGVCDLDRLKKTGKRMASPVGGMAFGPIDSRDRLGKQLFDGAEHALEPGHDFGLQIHSDFFSSLQTIITKTPMNSR